MLARTEVDEKITSLLTLTNTVEDGLCFPQLFRLVCPFWYHPFRLNVSARSCPSIGIQANISAILQISFSIYAR